MVLLLLVIDLLLLDIVLHIGLDLVHVLGLEFLLLESITLSLFLAVEFLEVHLSANWLWDLSPGLGPVGVLLVGVVVGSVFVV